MKKTKKLLAAALAAIMLTAAYVPAHAAEIPSNVVWVILDGKLVDFEDTYAMALENFTYVPIAKIITLLTGKAPDWDAANKMASFTFNGKSYKIYQNQKGIYIDGVLKPFETYPKIVNNRTMIPLRMLSDALGFQIDWDGVSRTATLKSPAGSGTAAVDIITVFPRAPETSPADEVTIKVTGNAASASAKITDPGGVSVATSSDSTASGNNRVFELKFRPETAGTYRAYVLDSSGKTAERSLPVEVKFVSLASINSISLSSSSVVLDENVSITVYATLDTQKVTLESEDYGGDTVSSTNYSTSSNERIFKFDWKVRSSYYSNLSTVAARVYAVDKNDKKGDYRGISVKVDKDGPVIHDFYASSSSLNSGGSTKITLETSSNVTRVTFDITSGSGSVNNRSMSSCTSESGGRRFWENTFYAEGSSTSSKIVATAENSSGSYAEKTITISVTGGDYSISSDISTNATPVVGSDVKFYIKTGADVNYVVFNFNGSDYRADSEGTSGTVKYWAITLRPTTSGSNSVRITTYDSDGYGRQSYTHNFTAVE